MHLHPFLEELFISIGWLCTLKEYARWYSTVYCLNAYFIVTVFMKTNDYADLIPSVIPFWSFLDLLVKETRCVLDGVFRSSLFTFSFCYLISCGGAQVLPTLQTSILILVNNSPGGSVELFLDHRFQYYFIGDSWKKKEQKSSPGFQKNYPRRGKPMYICH